MNKRNQNPGKHNVISLFTVVVQTLHDLDICIDENGRLRCIDSHEILTKETMKTDPLLTMAAITHYVVPLDLV